MRAIYLFLAMALASFPAGGAAVAEPRGMAYDTYIRLERGMSEGELILRAGRADQVTVENFQGDIVKSYYYYPTAADPYVSVVTVRGGRITHIERTKKF